MFLDLFREADGFGFVDAEFPVVVPLLEHWKKLTNVGGAVSEVEEINTMASR